MQKLKIPSPILVEGRYDKIKLDSVLEARILTTDGFGVFNRGEKMAVVRALANKSRIIVLTDSDGAGKLIRSHIGSAVPPERLIPLYVPQIKGKEKRKSEPSAAGLLGVEGQEQQLLHDLLAPFADNDAPQRTPLTKADLFEDGLTGGENSRARRNALAAEFALPADMTPNALLAALSVIATREEYKAAVKKIK